MRTVLGGIPFPRAVLNIQGFRSPTDLPALQTSGATNLVRSMSADLEKQTELRLPDFSETEHVGIFSDYGGNEADSVYLTYSFLFVSLDRHRDIQDKLESIRTRHGLTDPRREMAFKNLSYGPLDRALPEWLDASAHLHGLLFTLLIDKQTPSVVTNEHKTALKNYVHDARRAGFSVPTKPKSTERFLRIASVVAFWCSKLCKTNHRVLWLGDNDESSPSLENRKALTHVVGSMCATLRPDLLVTFSFGTEDEIREREDSFADLLSYPDLVAGSLANGVTMAMPGLQSVPPAAKMKEKSGAILKWLARPKQSLIASLFHCRPEAGGLRGRFGTITPNAETSSAATT